VTRALGRGRLEDEIRMVALLRRLGLPTDPAPFLDAQAFGFVHSDKKRRGDAVRFVCPAGPGDVSLTAVPIERLRAVVLGA
jgi:3-dehydroquinate synthetase